MLRLLYNHLWIDTICLILICLILSTHLAKGEVSISSTSVTAPVATRQDVYVGELLDAWNIGAE